MELYSASTGAFYTLGFSKSIPEDAVEITPEYKREILFGESAGLVISSDKNGQPLLVDRAEPSENEKQAAINCEARKFLAKTDWYVSRMTETGQDIPEEIIKKRAEARESVKDIE